MGMSSNIYSSIWCYTCKVQEGDNVFILTGNQANLYCVICVFSSSLFAVLLQLANSCLWSGGHVAGLPNL